MHRFHAISSFGVPRDRYLNVGCVTDPALARVDQARAWYASLGLDLAWSALLPAGSPWPHGRFLLSHRIMALRPEDLSEARGPAGLVVRRAGTEDAGSVVAVDAGAFGTDTTSAREWMEPQMSFAEIEVAIGELDGVAVSTGYALRCDGEAGPTLYLGGIAVLAKARRKGVASSLSSWLLARGFDHGASFAHLETDSEGAAMAYAGLGFSEGRGIDIYAEI